MKTTRIAVLCIPPFLMGLWMFFGVPAYLANAPEWYFQLPSVLPSEYWPIAAKAAGLGCMLPAGLIIVLSILVALKTNKKPRPTKGEVK